MVDHKSHTSHRWRQAVLGSWLSGWGHILLFLGFHMRPRVSGWENLEAARKLRALLIFNHVSYTDGLILVTLFRTCGVAKVPELVLCVFDFCVSQGGCLWRDWSENFCTMFKYYVSPILKKFFLRAPGVCCGNPLLRQLRQGAAVPLHTAPWHN